MNITIEIKVDGRLSTWVLVREEGVDLIVDHTIHSVDQNSGGKFKLERNDNEAISRKASRVLAGVATFWGR